MVLAAGTFFWLARALLALSPHAGPALAGEEDRGRRRRWSAPSPIASSPGSEVATERSLVMTLVMFGADPRRPAGARRCATSRIAALIVLAREPESLLGPSFQMSFGAVAALSRSRRCCSRRSARSGAPRLARRARRPGRSGASAVGLVADDPRREPRDGAVLAPITSRRSTRSAWSATRSRCRSSRWSSCRRPSLGVLAYPFGLDGPSGS